MRYQNIYTKREQKGKQERKKKKKKQQERKKKKKQQQKATEWIEEINSQKSSKAKTKIQQNIGHSKMKQSEQGTTQPGKWRIKEQRKENKQRDSRRWNRRDNDQQQEKR